jgi:hypothetical protein
MYWNNPIINLTYPSAQDPIKDSLHGGNHCLFYNPAVNKHDIYNPQSLQDLCDWVNIGIAKHGWLDFLADPKNYYDLANLVKLNLWVHDLPIKGSIKPMLLTYTGNKYNSDFDSGTGASRLRAMERIPAMQNVSAFITTGFNFRSTFAHLEEITTFDRFAELCQAVPEQKFLFRLTNPSAPFGLDWYEYDSQFTAAVTPGENDCLTALTNYMKVHPTTSFTPEWFESAIDWRFNDCV